MSYPYRTVLTANIGQWASVNAFNIATADYFTITHLDEVSVGGPRRGNNLVLRSQFSGHAGVDISPFPMVQNQNVFVRRFRLASTLSAHGLKIWQKGKLVDAVPTPSADLTYFKIQALKVSDSSLYGNLEVSNVAYQLNEWEDINKYLWKPTELVARAPWYFAVGEFSVGVDATDIASRCVGTMLDLRLELEVDL
jgi:hypothetical protein